MRSKKVVAQSKMCMLRLAIKEFNSGAQIQTRSSHYKFKVALAMLFQTQV